ncbi:hypothetical protein P13BB106kb_p111 [Pectobacterium phage DU_PP_V]|uniref:Distal tail protein n=1 Tax=Pectobacterium phage DU_PP_V TaxID=2041492 RepID=A0A2D2W723_9CAUD|nr:distal tail protein [Pectobacterium phage DU_PP_V]ATS94095.1 hypothetical protein P13BB106kb_p111 [Pectobacterium phage DU_PP_V]
MRLPDPFTHPMYPGLGFTTADLIDNDPVIREELPNGKVSEIHISAQYWGIEIGYSDMLPEEYNILSASILNYKRSRGTFEVVLPQYEAYRVRGNTALTSIPLGQKGNSLVINNTNVLSGKPNLGDLFKLSNHSKVYKIVSLTENANSWTLGLYPDLFITTTGNEKPVFTGILFTTKLMNGDNFRESITIDGIYSPPTLQLREHIQ